VNQLKDLANASPAIKLFAEWCEKCTEDPLWRGRFKVRCACASCLLTVRRLSLSNPRLYRG
jgi:uncharacterized protein (DUF983 family)